MLVTGAASGMGRATARVFAAEGANVAVTDYAAEGAQGVAAEIAASGGNAKAWTLDVANRDDIAAVVNDIAAHFGIRAGDARPFSLNEWVHDKQPVWTSLVRRHGLAETRLDEVADWAFADFHWSHGYDVVSDPAKLRATGFPETIDSGKMLLGHLQRYREARILP